MTVYFSLHFDVKRNSNGYPSDFELCELREEIAHVLGVGDEDVRNPDWEELEEGDIDWEVSE